MTGKTDVLTCYICNQSKKRSDVLSGHQVRNSITQIIQQQHPGWDVDKYICFADLNQFRSVYLETILTREKGTLTQLESDVLQSFKVYETVSKNINTQFDQKRSIGQKVADFVADFGGSWTFIISFFIFISCWISLNTVHVFLSKAFDPYPYILLNLVLSCISAMQAPIIMMSQKRQENRDRLRSENDYRVNLKAELEIQHLNAKMDILLNNLWTQLMEVQNLQLDILQQHEKDTNLPHSKKPVL